MMRVLWILVSCLLVIVIGGQVYRYINDRHDTREAVLTTINEDIPFEGVIIRDEKVLTYPSSDVISYSYTDGSKVSRGDIVAKVFSNQEDAAASSSLERINQQIELLRRAQNPGTTDYVQPESISRKIDDYYKQLVTDVNESDFSDFKSEKDNMMLVMNIYNIVSGISQDYNARIFELESKAAELRQQAALATAEIAAPETGYFVSSCDGYEDKLNTSMVLSLTKDDIEQIISGEDRARNNIPESAIGKMFSDYTGLIVGVIDTDSRVTEESRLSLTMDSSDTVYEVTVVSAKDAGDNKTVVVLSCDSLDEQIASSRIHSMQLIFDEYSGIKVPRSAIRFQGEEKGVYVILGENITFKKIDVIYEGSDFVLSMNTSDDEYLRMYDQILLEVVSEEDVREANEKQQVIELPGDSGESQGDTGEDSGE